MQDYMNKNKHINAIYVGKKYLNMGTMTIKQYAQAKEVNNIFAQLTRIFLKKANCPPVQVMNQFINETSNGQNILLKPITTFNKSSFNRICFLYNFIKIFQVYINLRNGLLCCDFPKEVILRSVVLFQGAGMEKLVDSNKFINALYINFVYTEYVEHVLQNLFEGNQKLFVSFSKCYGWIADNDLLIQKHYEKPSFLSLVQTLLDLMKKKGYLRSQNSIIFLTQENCQSYIKEQEELFLKFHSINKQSQGICFTDLLIGLMQCFQHQKCVVNNLNMFENSSTWISQAQKILTMKQINDVQPLNSKKMKSKK